MESVCFTPEYIRDYIISQLKENAHFLFNELDLQMFVARSLEGKFKNGYRVHLEYRLPKKWNKDFDKEYERWGETPYFDIVLERIGENPGFIAIELKYKLKEVRLNKGVNFTRFGESPSYNTEGKDKIPLVTNQSAEDEGRYDFWKDVKRIELLTNHFSRIEGGVALFLTNQKSYISNNSENKCTKFNLTTEPKTGFLHWDYNKSRICISQGNCGDCDCKKKPCGEKVKEKPAKYEGDWGSEWNHWKRPNFSLDGTYEGKWYEDIKLKIDQEGCQVVNFYCYSVLIPSYSNNA